MRDPDDHACVIQRDRYYPTWMYRGWMIQKPGSVYLIGLPDGADGNGDLADVMDMAEGIPTAKWKIDQMINGGR